MGNKQKTKTARDSQSAVVVDRLQKKNKTLKIKNWADDNCTHHNVISDINESLVSLGLPRLKIVSNLSGL
ncbi:MAG: hypothetical protein V3U87_04155 [Methylococcaceae bacterium]